VNIAFVNGISSSPAVRIGAFPPVMIDVEAGGHRYQEMNVDGGAVSQMFLYPADLGLRVNFRTGPFARERHAYLIRNARLDPDWASVNRDFLTITERAIDNPRNDR
jgi:hypothetical protein